MTRRIAGRDSSGKGQSSVQPAVSLDCNAEPTPHGSGPVLGIETSVQAGGLALVEFGRILGQRQLDPTGRRHARTLLAEIDDLLQAHGLTPAKSGGYAVSIGPGSFTGLRVGVVAAKTLAWATDRPLVAIDTLLAVAENSPAEVEQLAVVANAQRGDLFVGWYQRDEQGRFRRTGPVTIISVPEFCRRCDAGDVVGGPGVALLETSLPSDVRVLPAACRLPRAAVVAKRGESAMREGRTADPWSLEPFYMRPSAAEEKRDDKRGARLNDASASC